MAISSILQKVLSACNCPVTLFTLQLAKLREVALYTYYTHFSWITLSLSLLQSSGSLLTDEVDLAVKGRVT